MIKSDKERLQAVTSGDGQKRGKAVKNDGK